MYILTNKGKKEVQFFIDNLYAKRKEILDAGKDTADDTNIPDVEDIIADMEFDGVDKEGDYYNSWGVTDNYDSDGPLGLQYGVDFVEEGYIPDDDIEVKVVEQYTMLNDSYKSMLPGTVVLDYTFNSYWRVLSNDGEEVVLQNTAGGEKGAKLVINDNTQGSLVFSLLARTEFAPQEIDRDM